MLLEWRLIRQTRKTVPCEIDTNHACPNGRDVDTVHNGFSYTNFFIHLKRRVHVNQCENLAKPMHSIERGIFPCTSSKTEKKEVKVSEMCVPTLFGSVPSKASYV